MARGQVSRGPDTLISDVVDRGMQEGWLKRFRRDPSKTGTEMLYLIESGEAEPSQPEPVEPPAVPAAAPVTEVVSFVERDAPPANETVEPPAQAAGEPNVKGSVLRPSLPERAVDFRQALSDDLIGGLPESREFLFDALESTVKSGARVLIEVFSEGLALAQQRAEETGYSAEKNWPIALRCAQRLMLRSMVVLDSAGKPIPDTIGRNSATVASLQENFRKICEAYMLERIIATKGPFSYDDDLYYAGLTLFRRGKKRAVSPDQLIAKVDSLLEFLLAAGRIQMDEQRNIHVVTPPAT